MAKTLLLALGVMAMAAGWAEATTISVAAEHPRFPGLCWTETGPIKPNDFFYLPHCTRGHCYRDESGMVINYETCPPVQQKEGCLVGADLKHNYPGCCPRLLCN
ncbi:U-scoloptoxin(16)-Cw1a-like [Penaeus chinensis]|uniref:U-scoloptoxin(16)-Cw1a-like n=1 Tax=Penaeus chinensis TaxID=139456 RepID=UPI001FB7CC84|nr:U-scoloptoxin(16)-Cw1a-like [Penaeus chinensis]